MRLRQIALVAWELDPVVAQLEDVLGLETCFHDPAMGHFGLHNAILPLAGNFVEVLAPIRSETPACRYLSRHGSGGYKLVFECDDVEGVHDRLEAKGVRTVFRTRTPGLIGYDFHPADVPGCLISIESPRPAEDWHQEMSHWPLAGPLWKKHIRTDRTQALTAVEMQAEDPEAVAARWADLFQLPVRRNAAGDPQIEFDNVPVRFVPDRDGRGLSLSGMDVLPQDRWAILTAAERRGLPHTDQRIDVAGMRVNLI